MGIELALIEKTGAGCIRHGRFSSQWRLRQRVVVQLVVRAKFCAFDH